MTENRLLATECVHLRNDTLEHAHTLVLETSELVDNKYRYGTGPDRMKLCGICTGRLLAFMLSPDVSGVPQ